MSIQKKSLITNHAVVKKAILAKSVGLPTATGSISAPKVATKVMKVMKSAQATKFAMKAMKATKATKFATKRVTKSFV